MNAGNLALECTNLNTNIPPFYSEEGSVQFTLGH